MAPRLIATRRLLGALTVAGSVALYVGLGAVAAGLGIVGYRTDVLVAHPCADDLVGVAPYESVLAWTAITLLAVAGGTLLAARLLLGRAGGTWSQRRHLTVGTSVALVVLTWYAVAGHGVTVLDGGSGMPSCV